MKIVVIRFPEATDVSALTWGTVVSVKAGTVEVMGGTVNSMSSMEESPAAVFVPHTHDEGATGPAIPVP